MRMATSEFGTFETWRIGLSMSVDGAKSEVAGGTSNRRV